VKKLIDSQRKLGAVFLPFFQLGLVDIESFGLGSIKTKIIDKSTVKLRFDFLDDNTKSPLVFFTTGRQFYFEHRGNYTGKVEKLKLF